jgi:hypothetical protein
VKKFFLAMLLFVSCRDEQKIPEGILTEEKMVNILVRLHLSEARVSIKNLPVDTSRKYFLYLENKVLKSYGTDTAAFNKSYHYYITHEKKFDAIYTSVVDSLSLREARKIIN